MKTNLSAENVKSASETGLSTDEIIQITLFSDNRNSL